MVGVVERNRCCCVDPVCEAVCRSPRGGILFEGKVW